jgi:hypothetical protein
MGSTNYKISYSVTSGGGGSRNSVNFQADDTLGQSSPLIDQNLNPFSDHYDNYPGFWHMAVTCPGDYKRDRDVDGQDLEAYISGRLGIGLDAFAAKFGRVGCP